MVKVGDILTWINDGITTTHKKGQKAKVTKVYKTPGHWLNFFNIYKEETIDGVEIEGDPRKMYFLHCFEETK